MIDKPNKICVIGLGYVGLPLAIEFSKKYPTIGFDTNSVRINELNTGYDVTDKSRKFETSNTLHFSVEEMELDSCNVFIVAVPTPVDKFNKPDLIHLEQASEMIGRHITVNDIVIYESTTYPGTTEDVCVPIIEKKSGLIFNKDFWVGYSPERINPGDTEHSVTNIVKVTSGSTEEAATFVDNLYNEIITAGTYKASSIKVAEASKVIENIQRDVNIALMNELAMIFNQLDINTTDVLSAAKTKWNFLPFEPGLVGGHCISVDPYYLIHKASQIGCNTDVISASRTINNNMGGYIASSILKLMVDKPITINKSKVLIMGITYKEDCADIRNTQVVNIINELKDHVMQVDVFDPCVNTKQLELNYNISTITELKKETYDVIVLAVRHNEFLKMSAADIHSLGKEQHIIYDVKSILPDDETDGRL